jgi:hypothetical protein
MCRTCCRSTDFMAYNKLSTEQKLLTKAQWINGCLVWVGDRWPRGYGRIRHAGRKSYAAHRLMYELKHGPIAEGQVIRHKCDNPPCINPDHLELGSVKDNVADMFARGRANRASGERHGGAKLTISVLEIIRRRYRPRDPANGLAALARELALSRATVAKVVHKRTHFDDGAKS